MYRLSLLFIQDLEAIVMLTKILERLTDLLIAFTVIVMALILVACGGGGGQAPGTAAAEQNPIATGAVGINNDQNILKVVYFDNRTPDDFYTETYPDSDVYYSVSNVKNVEILPIADRPGIVRYELSAVDFTEALILSEQAAANMPVYKQLVDNRETDLFYEFTRVDLVNPQFVHLSRVFKVGALDRSGVDLDQTNGYQGKITLPILSADRVKMIMEYFWTFSFSNNTGNAVLESTTIEYDTNYIHTMVEAKLNIQPSGVCDTIEMFETTYIVQKGTGDVFRYQEMTGEISSKRYGNELVMCDSSTFN